MRTIAFGIFRRWITRLGLFWIACFILVPLVSIPLSVALRRTWLNFSWLGGPPPIVDIAWKYQLTLQLVCLSILLYALLAALAVVYVRSQLKKERRIATTLRDFVRLRDTVFDFHQREGRFPDSIEELKDECQMGDSSEQKKIDVRFLSNLGVGVVAASAKPWRTPFGFCRNAVVILEDGSIVQARGAEVSRLDDVVAASAKPWRTPFGFLRNAEVTLEDGSIVKARGAAVVAASSDRRKDVGRFYASNGKLRFERGKEFASAFCPMGGVALMTFLALATLYLLLLTGFLTALFGRATYEEVGARHTVTWQEARYLATFYFELIGAPIAILFLALGGYSGWLHWRAGSLFNGFGVPFVLALVGFLLLCAFLCPMIFISLPILFSGSSPLGSLEMLIQALEVLVSIFTSLTVTSTIIPEPLFNWALFFWYVLATPFLGIFALFP